VRHLDVETNFELYVGAVHAAGMGTAPVQRLGAALQAARQAEPRTIRPRTALDRAATSPEPSIDRPRSALPIRSGSRVR
jgi:hypothetical protein